jgi:hypothetical protein
VDIKELLIDGTTKKIYATNQNDQVVVAFNDSEEKRCHGRKSGN